MTKMHRNIVAEDDAWPLWCFCVQHSLSTWRIVQQSSCSTRSVSSIPAASFRVFKVLPWSLQPFWKERFRLAIARSQMCPAHQMGIGAPMWWSPGHRRPQPASCLKRSSSLWLPASSVLVRFPDQLPGLLTCTILCRVLGTGVPAILTSNALIVGVSDAVYSSV